MNTLATTFGVVAALGLKYGMLELVLFVRMSWPEWLPPWVVLLTVILAGSRRNARFYSTVDTPKAL